METVDGTSLTRRRERTVVGPSPGVMPVGTDSLLGYLDSLVGPSNHSSPCTNLEIPVIEVDNYLLKPIPKSLSNANTISAYVASE